MGTSPAIVYITEVAKPELRGALIATCPTLASFGKVITWAHSAKGSSPSSLAVILKSHGTGPAFTWLVKNLLLKRRPEI
jgi:hypothetical protein